MTLPRRLIAVWVNNSGMVAADHAWSVYEKKHNIANLIEFCQKASKDAVVGGFFS